MTRALVIWFLLSLGVFLCSLGGCATVDKALNDVNAACTNADLTLAVSAVSVVAADAVCQTVTPNACTAQDQAYEQLGVNAICAAALTHSAVVKTAALPVSP